MCRVEENYSMHFCVHLSTWRLWQQWRLGESEDSFYFWWLGNWLTPMTADDFWLMTFVTAFFPWQVDWLFPILLTLTFDLFLILVVYVTKFYHRQFTFFNFDFQTCFVFILYIFLYAHSIHSKYFIG